MSDSGHILISVHICCCIVPHCCIVPQASWYIRLVVDFVVLFCFHLFVD